jgi:hypothetical protein
VCFRFQASLDGFAAQAALLSGKSFLKAAGLDMSGPYTAP